MINSREKSRSMLSVLGDPRESDKKEKLRDLDFQALIQTDRFKVCEHNLCPSHWLLIKLQRPLHSRKGARLNWTEISCLCAIEGDRFWQVKTDY